MPEKLVRLHESTVEKLQVMRLKIQELLDLNDLPSQNFTLFASLHLGMDILEKGSEGLLGRYLPRGTKIGNKIGSISDPECGDDLLDVGVINGDYALAVMCNRIGKRKNHLLKKRLASEKNYREQLLVKEHWDKVKKKLDHLHHSEDLPFYFEVQAHPRFYGQQGRSAADVIGIISKVIHNIYYAGKIMSFGQEICRPR